MASPLRSPPAAAVAEAIRRRFGPAPVRSAGDDFSVALKAIKGLQRRRGLLINVTSIKDALCVALLLRVCKREDFSDVHSIHSDEPAARYFLRAADALQRCGSE